MTNGIKIFVLRNNKTKIQVTSVKSSLKVQLAEKGIY